MLHLLIMITHGRVGAKLYTFLTLVLDEGEWITSCPRHFTPGDRFSHTNWTGAWVGTRFCLDIVTERKCNALARNRMQFYLYHLFLVYFMYKNTTGAKNYSCILVSYLQGNLSKWAPKTSLYCVVYPSICSGGNSDCKPNHNKDHNMDATNKETKMGEWWQQW
jgi:hypothetical protein